MPRLATPRALPPVPSTAIYDISVLQSDKGFVARIYDRLANPHPTEWLSKPFRTIAAAWRTLLRELARRQGLD